MWDQQQQRQFHAVQMSYSTSAPSHHCTTLLLHSCCCCCCGLQSLNPLPFVAMAANCTLGSMYGQITRDWYLYTANMIGVMLSESTEPEPAHSKQQLLPCNRQWLQH